jgi:hypothetical protein
MQYLLLMYFDETWDQLSVTARQQIYEEQLQLAHQLTASGQYLAGAPLHPPSTATTVRVRHGKQLVTDGPFAETREQLGGYMLIDVTDPDEARRRTRAVARGLLKSAEGRATDVASAWPVADCWRCSPLPQAEGRQTHRGRGGGAGLARGGHAAQSRSCLARRAAGDVKERLGTSNPICASMAAARRRSRSIPRRLTPR